MRQAIPASTQSATDARADGDEHGERRLRYELIRQKLRTAIVGQRIVPGLVLLEGPVAKVFGTSRIPVRKAFELLHEEGLLTTFDGRGYLVAQRGQHVLPQRLPLDAHALGQDATDAIIRIPSESERIHDELEQSICTAMIFGCFHIDENAAMAHFNVNRVALREVLSRLVDRGLVEKSTYASWRVAALTARAVNQDFDRLALLAPEALRESAPRLDREWIGQLRRDLSEAHASACKLQDIEQQLHGACLAQHPNDKLLAMLDQCQMPWLIHRIFCRMFPQAPHPGLHEHCRQVLDALGDQAPDRAAQALRDYLAQARKRAQLQLKVLSVLPEPEVPSYLLRQA